MMNRFIKLASYLVLGVSLQSCIAHRIPEGGTLNAMDGCYRKLDGKLVSIKCQRHERPIMSTDQRSESIGRFRDFMISSKHKIALEMSMQREADGITIDYRTLNQYGDELKMMEGDKYVVRLLFRNYSLFPKKYYYHKEFKTDSSDIFKEKWTNQILKHYLGDGYENYEPKLGIVEDDRVSIQVLVNGLNGLREVVYRDPLISIRHIGDIVHPLEEIAI